jgi:Phospholipid methyltransferase
MRHLQDIRASLPLSAIIKGQVQHAMLAALLTIGTCTLLTHPDNGLWGISALHWAYLAIAAGIFHQSMVAVVWRLQLHFALMTRLFGANALKVWGAMFLPFLFLRPILVIMAGIADANSLGGSRNFNLLVGALLVVLAGWGANSVIRYFTIPRALGGDHFEDKYLNMPMVNKGAFKYSPNAMYGIVFMGFWGIALLTNSWNALVLALFQHAYIWVHMYCTEDPDMQVLYKDA